jgi:hypothetical protein
MRDKNGSAPLKNSQTLNNKKRDVQKYDVFVLRQLWEYASTQSLL